jgi:hypothetical protein
MAHCKINTRVIDTRVIGHLKKDIETFKHEADEDKKLIKAIKKKTKKNKRSKQKST